MRFFMLHRMSLSPWMFAALAVLGLAACTPTPEPSGFDAQSFDIATNDGVTLGSDATTTGDLSGTWVLVTDWSTCVAIGDEIELRNYELSRVEIVQDGVQLREHRIDCSVANTPILGLTTVVPPPAVASAGTIQSNAFVPAHFDGAPYTGGVEVQTWGLKFNNDPETESMPLNADDPRVVDSDSDGHPGVTLKVGGVCDLYAVQRAIMSRTGKLNADGSMSGDATRHVVQVALGSSQGFCAQAFSTVSNQTNNHWKMLRVDKQGMNLDQDGDGIVTCDEIVQNQSVFTNWVEPDDTRCASYKQP
jgi:hypothetical protein